MSRSKSMGGSPTPKLPLAQYIGAQGVLACLLVSSITLLPRTTSFTISPSLPTSLDRPQYLWLDAITQDPTKSMICDVAGVAMCALWWAPSLRAWWSPVRSKDKAQRVEETMRRIGGATIATSLAILILTLLLFLLGSSLETHPITTLLLSCHLCLLSVWPTVYALGSGFLYNPKLSTRFTVTRMFGHFSCESGLERAVVYPVIGLVIGAWAGCATFALDWDRPWQAFPLPPVFGSIIGYIIGGLVCWGTSLSVQ